VTAFLQSVTANSFATNRDGDGIALGNKVHKRLAKLNLFKYDKEIKAEKYILTHQRISTSGFSKEYTQPFKSAEFILAHNGVMREFEDKKDTHSDTFNFFARFRREFKKAKGDREERVVSAIKELLDGSYGGYSIVIKDLIEDCLYYFKDYGTSISCFMNKNYLYLTTKGGNQEFISLLGEHLRELELEDYSIYKITNKKSLAIYEVGCIDEPYKSHWSDSSTNSDRGSGFKAIEVDPSEFDVDKTSDEKAKDKADELMQMGFGKLREMDVAWKCDSCSRKCNTMNTATGIYVCRDCYAEEITEFLEYNATFERRDEHEVTPRTSYSI
jgi:hypothetical protein